MDVGVHGPVSHSYTQHSLGANSALQRIHTAVAQHPPLMHTQSHSGGGSSSYSIQSGPSARSSATTHGNSTGSFMSNSLPASSLSSGFGPMQPPENVMNKVGEKEQSLFQICLGLRHRLKGVPGYEEYFKEEEREIGADEDTDPVSLMWRTFRRGYPLLALYNVLRADRPIQPDLSDVTSELKRGKTMTFKFLNALIHDLKFRVEDCFILLDLYGDDTTGFVKVTKTVTRLLDILLERRLIQDTRRATFANANPGGHRSQRQHIVDELVNTERTYVQQLELLQDFQLQCQKTGVIPGDVIHSIFLNLNGLLDFQRRFLIRVEQINALPEDKQNWGKLFISNNDLFDIYEPYITNQKQCEETVMREFERLRNAGGPPALQAIVATPTTLYGFLMKPFQRLSKYPLLLNELYKKGDYDEERRADLLYGKECATAVLTRTNTAMDRQDKVIAVQELKGRVEDWKGHRVEAFGELLLFGLFTVIKSDGGPTKDSEREYHVYFFESILLCCKDHDPTKIKAKGKAKPVLDKRVGKTKLQLKGRIFMQNVTNVVSSSKQGHYTCQIFWKGDPGIESFTIRFLTEELMNKWHERLLEQQRLWHEATKAEISRTPGTSSTEFTYLQNQGQLENPYRDDTDDDDASTAAASANTFYPSSSDASAWNASRASLRSRSATGESVQRTSSGHEARPRLAPGSLPQPIQLIQASRNSGAASPALKFADSYFSPSLDSPMSSRASTSSGMYFPRASAGPDSASILPYRAASRETMGSGTSHTQSARGLSQRPSFPTGSNGGSSSSLSQGNRNRSASSPGVDDAYRRANTSHPPLPDVVSNKLHYSASMPRSASNSPHLSGPIEGMVGEYSPRLQRDRSHPPSYPSGAVYGAEGGATRLSATQARNITPVPYLSRESPVSPPLPSATSMVSADSSLSPLSQPSQLKIKVHAPAASQVLTLVVPATISYQTLKDRIDAKLLRSTNITLSGSGPNVVKLKYLDDDDYVIIRSDDELRTAFETWREQTTGGGGALGEVELFCQ